MQGQPKGQQNSSINGFEHQRKGSDSAVLYVFLVVGLVLVFSTFTVLQSVVRGAVVEEQVHVSQDFVEEIVSDFRGLSEPLKGLAAMMALSFEMKEDRLSRYINQEHSAFEAYSQIVWFYETPDKEWTFSYLRSNTLQNEINGGPQLKPDAEMLKVLLKLEVSGDLRLVPNVGGFEQYVRSQNPKITYRPFALMKSVSAGGVRKGFLLAVVDVASLYDEGWATGHQQVLSMRIQDVESNNVLFEFVRNPETTSATGGRQVYEFSFAGRHFEVASDFQVSQRVRLLGGFPYMVAFLAVFLVVAGAFFVHYGQKQAYNLKKMNDTLARKNFELKAEVEERERLADAVEAAERSSRAVVDAIGDIIFEADRDGRIVFLNRAWEKVTGFDVGQSTGQNLEQLVYPQDREEVMRGLRAVLYEGKDEARSFTQIRVADGTFKAVELVMKAVARNTNGGHRHDFVVGTFTNIEERRKVERALSDAEKKYRSIVENAVGGIFQMTSDGLYLSANPAMAKILGYDSPEQLLRGVKNANEQVYVDTAKRQSVYDRLTSLPEALSHEVKMYKRDGEIIWVHENIRGVVDDSGQLLFIEGSVEDITRRKNSDLAIQEAKVHSDLANRAKSEFLANMSHELRTPLNSIIGFSEMIKNEVCGTIQHRPYWEYACDIHESGHKLLQVINEILDISKIEAGDRQLNESVVNIEAVFDSVAELLETKIENAHLHITRALGGVPNIIVEELALKQILLNLLSNAVKFTPYDGRITVSAQLSREGDMHISITDTGVGLDEYEIKKALSPFGQVDNDLSRSGSGTGLGLTLVGALVGLHGGSFDLFSKKGIGTTATVILPAERVVRDKREAASVSVKEASEATE
ncbi:MAG TPA: PAS domain-containing sensor histidine kinase [Alphaproteobacteria bacterium]|nr:PAS domain-containing sensor histidine kinase [Alphaproteobacteria bacterium]USO06020.1 MAG: PAS domain-containing sensor histidine kinase [Rhodospirillales bacterium]HOO81767.1 PAS domain-containing sensor histidine kinase [Alphaproteobacteria bacterium]